MQELLNTITTGDAKELAKLIPDESIDLIFTDPIYERVEDYAWLGGLAMRTLKPDSALLAFVSTNKLFDCKAALENAGLIYRWVLYYATPGSQKTLHLYGVFNCVTPCLIFTKGKRKASPYLQDFFETYERAENGFSWQKNTRVIRKWATAFTKPDDLVLDPFSGSGTLPVVCKQTNRNFIAFEMDVGRAEMARQRVANAQPPLFILDSEKQLDLFSGELAS